MMSVAVIRSVQRSCGRSTSRRGRGPAKEASSTLEEDQERRRRVAACNVELPKFAGTLIEKHRDCFGTQTGHQRWVVLDPAEATLSIWDQMRREAPRKVFSMIKIVEVDSNPSFRNIFLWFEKGESVALTAERSEDFQGWMDAFAAYDVSRVMAQPEQSLALQIEATHRQQAVLQATNGEAFSPNQSESPQRSKSPQRGCTRQTNKQAEQRCTEQLCNFRAQYQKCYLSEPSPEPAPGFQDEKRVRVRTESEPSPEPWAYEKREDTDRFDYNTGPMETNPLRKGLACPMMLPQPICEP